MKLYLVSEDMFSLSKSKIIYKRFLDYIGQNPCDALCIANSTSENIEEIESFKKDYLKKGKGMIFSNDTPLLIYSHTYPLTSMGLEIGEDKTIYPATDAICSITIDKDLEIEFHYIALDLFMNTIPSKPVVQNFEFPLFNELPKNGKPLVMPLQKFIEMIEENMDDETREKIRKAKEDFNAKTKS